MKVLCLASFILLLSIFGKSQSISLDTLQSHCTICSFGNEFWGHHDMFYDAKKCPRKKKKKYYREHKIWIAQVATNRIYWLKLFDIKENLIFEGLCYSDCIVGPFKSYYLNGNIRLEGSYNGYLLDPIKGYIFLNCENQKKGEWIEYNKDGSVLKKEIYL
jgi:hypothetical protein